MISAAEILFNKISAAEILTNGGGDIKTNGSKQLTHWPNIREANLLTKRICAVKLLTNRIQAAKLLNNLIQAANLLTNRILAAMVPHIRQLTLVAPAPDRAVNSS